MRPSLTATIIALCLSAPGAVRAADTAATTQVYRLTPAERDAVIAQAAQQPERQALLPAPDAGTIVATTSGLAPSAERDAILGSSLYGEARPDRRPHGEVGMFVGTGGARGFYGTTGVPVGDNGYAQFSFSTGRAPGYGYGGPYGYGGSYRYGPPY